MKKHKKRFIIPIILLLMILLICGSFCGSCRKTNALENSYYSSSSFYLTTADTNSGCIFFYNPTEFNDQDFMKISYLDHSQSTKNGYFGIKNNKLCVYFGSTYFYLDSTLNRNYCFMYIILGQKEIGSPPDTSLACQIGVVYYTTGRFYNYTSTYIYFDTLSDKQDLFDTYNYSPGIRIYPYMQNSIPFNGLSNGYVIDCLDYNGAFSEYSVDIRDDYALYSNNVSYLYNTGYDNGYQVGYDDGYDAGYTAGYSAGETAGETAGYSAGYTDGYSAGEGEGYRAGYDTGYDDGYDAGLLAGYNNGYAAGLADNVAGQTEAYNAGYGQGRHDGYVEGYDRGYNLGYDDGLANGMSGATPVSQTIGVVSSVFAGIGTVLSIQLFPGFPLGILILVPLFFAVLGLILWIWRRN